MEQVRPAVGLWIKVVLSWQVLVVAGSLLYVAVLASRHLHGVAWVAPAVGAVLGTALPLQVAAISIMRAGR